MYDPKLRDLLASMFPQKPDITRLVRDAGLSPERIEFGARAINSWTSALDEAHKQFRTIRLLDAACHDYPQNEELRGRIERFKERQEKRREALVETLGQQPGRSDVVIEVTASFARSYDDLLVRAFTRTKRTCGEVLSDPIPLLLIHAGGGQGKSNFVRRLAREAVGRGLEVFLLDIRGWSPPGEGEILESLFGCAPGSAQTNHRDFRELLALDRPCVVILESLNEVSSELGDQALERMAWLAGNWPLLRVVAADRMNVRSRARAYARATIDPLEMDQVQRLLPRGTLDRLGDDERALLAHPFFLDLRLELAAGPGQKRQRKDYFEEYFSRVVGLGAPELVKVAAAAFEVYQSFETTAFDSAWWTGRAGEPASEKLLSAAALVKGGASDANLVFHHQLLHDYLVGYHVASKEHPPWIRATFDAATIKTTSLESLSFAAELVGAGVDAFIEALYDWSYEACFRTFTGLPTRPNPVSGDLRFALCALLAEKMFDSFEHTREWARSRLELTADDHAAAFAGATTFEEVHARVERMEVSDPRWQRWRSLFLTPTDTRPMESMLELLWSDPVTGWTAANVFRRVDLGPEQQAQLRILLRYTYGRGEFTPEAETLSWRIVHALGPFPSLENVEALERALLDPRGDARLDWPRFGALRSLVEIARKAGARSAIRERVFGDLEANLARFDTRQLARELRRTTAVSEADADWNMRAGKLVRAAASALRFAKADKAEKEEWEQAVKAFDAAPMPA